MRDIIIVLPFIAGPGALPARGAAALLLFLCVSLAVPARAQVETLATSADSGSSLPSLSAAPDGSSRRPITVPRAAPGRESAPGPPSWARRLARRSEVGTPGDERGVRPGGSGQVREF